MQHLLRSFPAAETGSADTAQLHIKCIDPILDIAVFNPFALSDECWAYWGIDRLHRTVCHSRREYARDDDGDGFCEVHCNTMEGLWTGLRNYLRPFRGVHKKYLGQYVIMFEWAHNLKRVNRAFLRALMIPGYTYDPA